MVLRFAVRTLCIACCVFSACGATPVTPEADAGVEVDAGATFDAGAEVDAGTPRCTVSEDAVTCPANISNLTAGTASRDVYWQTPSSPPPPQGYPVVVMYQGSFFGPSTTWGTVSSSTAPELRSRPIDQWAITPAPTIPIIGSSQTQP